MRTLSVVGVSWQGKNVTIPWATDQQSCGDSTGEHGARTVCDKLCHTDDNYVEHDAAVKDAYKGNVRVTFQFCDNTYANQNHTDMFQIALQTNTGDII